MAVGLARRTPGMQPVVSVGHGAQPKCHTQNLRQDRLSDMKGHCHGPMGPGQKVSTSGMRDTQQSSPFLASNDIVWYTTEEQLGIVAQHVISKETIRPLPILGGREWSLVAAKRCHLASLSKAPREARRGESGALTG
jgi:hypothetical protein